MNKKLLNFSSVKLDKAKEANCITKDKISPNDIAVIGMAANFPRADDVDQFWKNIRNGMDCVGDFPEERKKDTDRYLEFMNMLSGKEKYERASYLDEIDKFDCDLFGIPPREASLMDPNQRLFLQTAWSAIEDSGYGGGQLKGSKTGVYVGYKSALSNLYKRFVSEVDPDSNGIAIMGNKPPIIASRISYILDLHGPSMILDTACSATLVAIHLACQGIKNSDCDIAIAGGVKVILLPVDTSENLGIESSDGRTRAFDDYSEGAGPGEGAGAVILKSLSKAIKDGDNIYAIIKGSAVNQDGKSIGIAAPNAVAQGNVIVDAWKDAGINPETISYIETHGTGTKLGDLIEIDGIERAFKRFTNKKQFCGIGSVKSNMGHLDNAAGISGFIKAVLAVKNKEIPPSIHFDRPNKKADFIESPVYVNYKLKKWESQNNPIRCGVSSFGLNGTNCHVVLEEYVDDMKEADLLEESDKDKYDVITFSAKNKDLLRAVLKRYKEFLENDIQNNIHDICYTANVGRGHYDCRLIMIVKTVEDLKDKFNNLKFGTLENNNYLEGVYYKENTESELNINGFNEKNRDDILNNIFLNKKQDVELIQELCKMYIDGKVIEWFKFYKGEKRKKVSIPVYPFEKTRCWVEIPEGKKKVENSSNMLQLLDDDRVPEELRNELKNIIEKCVPYISDVSSIDNKKKETIVLIGKKDENYSDMEIQIAEIWNEFLGYKKINVNSSFYEIGGDSVLALRVVNRINKKIERNLRITDLIKNQTISSLAEFLESNNCSEQKSLLSSNIKKSDKKDYYSLSHAQKKLYYIEKYRQAGISQNMSSIILINSNLDKDKFETALEKIINRHESFRTSFKEINGEAVQVIHENVEFNIVYMESKEEELEELASKFVEPFNLLNAPLLRIAVVTINEEKYAIIIDMHHIISDGTSTGILLRELIQLYEGKELQEKDVDYKDFAEWQNTIIEKKYMEEQKEYWMSIIQGDIIKNRLPVDNERNELSNFDGNRIYLNMNNDSVEKIRGFAAAKGITLYMVLLAAYNILIYSYSNRKNLIIGSSISSRTNSDMDSIIGMFANIVPTKNIVSEDEPFINLLQRVNTNCLEIYKNQDCPIEWVMEEMLGYQYLKDDYAFDTMFVLQNTEVPDVDTEGLKVKFKELYNGCSKVDLLLEGFPNEDGIRFIFEYRTSLFKNETIKKLSKDYMTILDLVVDNPDIRTADIIGHISKAGC